MSLDSPSFSAIAIDGPAASGKSTVARILAERLGLTMVNSGEMYRAVTLAAVRRGVDPHDRAAVANMASEIDLSCVIENGSSLILLDGEHPGERLRSDKVNSSVSSVAAVSEVRHILVRLQRGLLSHSDLVLSLIHISEPTRRYAIE